VSISRADDEAARTKSTVVIVVARTHMIEKLSWGRIAFFMP
jgi:hypothetical protein